MLIPNAITLDGIRQTDNLAIIGICDSALYNKFSTAIASHKHYNSKYEHYDSLHILNAVTIIVTATHCYYYKVYSKLPRLPAR